MERQIIKELARICGSPVEREHAENIHIQCPFIGDPLRHPPSKGSPTLSVLVVPNGESKCICFRCGAQGTLASVFGDAHDVLGGFDHVVEFIRANDRGGLMAALARSRASRVAMPRDGAIEGPSAMLERYVTHCYRTGIDPPSVKKGMTRRDVEQWMVGFDADTGRATFPCWDCRGRLVGVSRRAVGDILPKYHDLPFSPWKRGVFYGEHRIDTTREHVRLVEGVTSTVFASRLLPNVLGFLGAKSKVGGKRLEKLRQWARW